MTVIIAKIFLTFMIFNYNYLELKHWIEHEIKDRRAIVRGVWVTAAQRARGAMMGAVFVVAVETTVLWLVI